jgi:C1A family cysteine protease
MTEPTVITPDGPRPGMGLVRDTEDRRDRVLFRNVPDINALPDEGGYDPTKMPQVLDQHTIGACVGYSTAENTYTTMIRDGHRRPFIPSPVFIYRQARLIGGYLDEDMGCEIRNAMKAANKWGLPPMSNIPPRFRSADMPNPQTWKFPPDSVWYKDVAPSHYADAERRQVMNYFKLPTLADLLQCLADGYTAVVGFAVFRSMYGIGGPKYHVPDPNPPNDRELGGHAVLAYRYSKRDRRVMFRNSWGASAHEGKPDFTLSFSYLERYSWDNWTTRWIEGGKKVA